MIEMVVVRGFMSGFKVGDVSRGCIMVSHLLFMDDTLIFSDANKDHLRALRALLLCFEAVFGLRINLNKFEIVPVSNIYNFANILDCKVSSSHEISWVTFWGSS